MRRRPGTRRRGTCFPAGTQEYRRSPEPFPPNTSAMDRTSTRPFPSASPALIKLNSQVVDANAKSPRGAGFAILLSILSSQASNDASRGTISNRTGGRPLDMWLNHFRLPPPTARRPPPFRCYGPRQGRAATQCRSRRRPQSAWYAAPKGQPRDRRHIPEHARRFMMSILTPAGSFRLGDRTVNRIGYGAMQLAGPACLVRRKIEPRPSPC